VTDPSPYQAYPGPAYPGAVPVLASPAPVLVAVADRAPQQRVTVAFRLILAVPHLIVLYLLALAASVVLFIGWWGALFTGRLPRFAVTFLSGYLRWSTRVTAYQYLLTDAYPPFTLDDDPAYPVRVAIPEPQRLNRAAVFFRFILIFPVNILTAVVILGAGTLMGFIAWLVTLITGQLPAPMHLAYISVLRFTARHTGYYWMLTPAYPGGLYGDRPGTLAWADALPAAQAPGFGAPVGYGTEGGYGVRPLFQPATWLLPLTSAAKKLVTTFIVLGSLALVAYVVIYTVFLGSVVNNTQTAVTATRQLNSSYASLSNSVTALDQATASCGQNLTCVTKQDSTAASAFTTFSGQLASTSVPAGAAADKSRLSAAAAASAKDFAQLSKVTSASQYQSTVASTGLQQELNGFDQDFTALVKKLQTY
jgi:hypothetical protein